MERRKFILLSTKTAATSGAGIFSSFALHSSNRGRKQDEDEDIPMEVKESTKGLGENTKWLRDSEWGGFSHYLVHMPSAKVPLDMTATMWNKKVNSFNVKLFAEQLSSVGVKYYFITIGQGGNYYCSPNKTYEDRLGPSLGKLSTRDLIADIAREFNNKGIRLCVYLPAVGGNNATEQAHWLAIIREWSLRWGKSISAWWIDGRYSKAEEFKSFTDAFKAGNPDALITYNTGPIGMNRDQLMPATEFEDYLAGEVDYILPTCGIRVFDGKQYYEGPDISGDQLHFLNFLGTWWGTGMPRFGDDFVTSWTRHINDHGGTVTWDIPLDPTGYISKDFINQLAELKKVSVISFPMLLDEMSNRAALARWPLVSWKSSQNSALEIKERHNVGNFANKAIGHFVRVEKKDGIPVEWVLMEHSGPGVITRIWAPNMAKDAILRFYFDGDIQPSIEVNMMKFVYGEDFVKPPLAALVARGGNVYLPIPFSKGCKVTVDKNVCGWAQPDDLFYIIEYRSYIPGTRVQTFSMKEYKDTKLLLNKAEQKLLNSGVENFNPVILFNDHIDSGKSIEIQLKKGSAAVNYLLLQIQAKDIEMALRNTVIKLTFDGIETVNCPAGDFFGSGSGLNPFSDWMRTVEKNGKMYCRWIMPYETNAKIRLECNGADSIHAQVAVNYQTWYWDERSMHFYSRWRFEKGINDLPASNFNYVSLKGRGLYVGDTLNVTNYSKKWWGEGPEKISVDEEPFPSHFGTGTEDYYGYAWGDRKIFDAPFHAQPKIPEGLEFMGTTVNTRIRSLDAIPFHSAFNLDMEVLTQGSMANELSKLDYGVAVYWYGFPGIVSE